MKYKFLQEGGQMPAESLAAPQGAPAEAGGAEQAMAQMAQQLVEMLMQQIGDPQAVAGVLQMALDMVASAAQGQQPTYQRNGGKIVRLK